MKRLHWTARAVLVAIAATGAVVFIQWRAPDQLLYNHSPSIPVGFYLRAHTGSVRASIVTVKAADVAPVEAARRYFTDDGDRFIKRIAAVQGDLVCAQGRRILVNGAVVATRRVEDSTGHRLSAWTGCKRLGPRDLLLLGDTPDSFDGRYWGIVTDDRIEGVWRPVGG